MQLSKWAKFQLETKRWDSFKKLKPQISNIPLRDYQNSSNHFSLSKIGKQNHEIAKVSWMEFANSLDLFIFKPSNYSGLDLMLEDSLVTVQIVLVWQG